MAREAATDLIEGRLANWGRWARSGAKASGSSPLYSLMVENDPDMARHEARTSSVDADDAAFIESKICDVCTTLEREILTMKFAQGVPERKMCRLYNIPRWRLLQIVQSIYCKLYKVCL